jgi:hypothetical protein
MAVEFLVHARSHKIYQKGAISQSVKDSPAVWGRMEALPDFIRVTVTDATKDDIAKYNQQWVEEYELTEEADFFRLQHLDRTSVNRPRLDQAKRNRFKRLMLEAGVTGDNVTVSGGGLLIQKVIDFNTIQEIVKDTLNVMHKHRMFHVRSAVIDNAVANNNDSFTITLAQLENNLVDGRN